MKVLRECAMSAVGGHDIYVVPCSNYGIFLWHFSFYSFGSLSHGPLNLSQQRLTNF